MARLITLVTTLALLLAACDGGAQPDGGNGDTQPESVSGVEGLERESFAFEVTGDLNISRRAATYDYVQLVDPELFEIALLAPDDGYVVRIVHFGRPENGTYDLQSVDTSPTSEAPFAIGLLSLTTPADRFATDVTGTITVQREGNALSGDFTFSASDGNDDRRVDVRGAFQALQPGE